MQIAIFIAVMGILFIFTNGSEELLQRPVPIQNSTASFAPTSWADLFGRVQSYLAWGALLIAGFVWYGRICDEWENNLPKRMSVFFFMDDVPRVVIRYVWLAEAGDMRAWGQQVARQAVSNQQLDFSN